MSRKNKNTALRPAVQAMARQAEKDKRRKRLAARSAHKSVSQ